jgi:hypothetical protein
MVLNISLPLGSESHFIIFSTILSVSMGKTPCRYPGLFIRAKGVIFDHLAAADSQNL